MRTAIVKLAAEEEIALGRRVRAWLDDGGDAADGIAARNELVERNLPLVPWVLGRYFHLPPSRTDDAEQEGNRGLMRAAEGFDPGRRIRFATYATYWVRQFIARWYELDRTIHIPVHAIQDGPGGKYWANAERAASVVSLTPLLDAGWGPTCPEPEAEDPIFAAAVVSRIIEASGLTDVQRDCLTAYHGIGRKREDLRRIAARRGYRSRQGPAQFKNAAIDKMREVVRADPSLRDMVTSIVGEAAI